VKTRFTGTWFISEMRSWDADYINLVGPGYPAVDPEGSGSMQFGGWNVDLDRRVEDIKSGKKLQFTFEGFDEGEPGSGRGWARIYSAAILFRQHEPPLGQFAEDLNIVPEIVSEIEEESRGTRGSLEISFQETHGRKLNLHIQRAHFKRRETCVHDLQSLLEDVESLEYLEQVRIDGR